MGGKQEDRARKCYGDIQQHYAAALNRSTGDTPPLIGNFENGRHSLLDIKTILVAVRLSAMPAVLILDEPDWGMSRPSAIAFVSAVLSAAHRQGTPVLLISHKPWWQSVCRSAIRVTRSPKKTSDTSDAPVFTITLAMEKGPL